MKRKCFHESRKSLIVSVHKTYADHEYVFCKIQGVMTCNLWNMHVINFSIFNQPTYGGTIICGYIVRRQINVTAQSYSIQLKQTPRTFELILFNKVFDIHWEQTCIQMYIANHFLTNRVHRKSVDILYMQEISLTTNINRQPDHPYSFYFFFSKFLVTIFSLRFAQIVLFQSLKLTY